MPKLGEKPETVSFEHEIQSKPIGLIWTLDLIERTVLKPRDTGKEWAMHILEKFSKFQRPH